MSNQPTNTALPKLRFPEFREAEWKTELFKDLYSFKGTNSFSRDKLTYEGGTIKNIHYGDIHTKFSTLFDITKEKVPFLNSSITVDKIKEENYCIEGDMLFADASEDLNDIGKSIEIVKLNGEKVLSGLHIQFARQKVQKLAIGFAGHLFMSNAIRAQIQNESQGTKVLGISAGRLSKIAICYPSDKREQQKIAATLSSIDDLLTAQTAQLTALQAHKRGLMQTLFPAEGETVPKLRFPEFQGAAEWEETTLGKLTRKVGSGITPTGGDKNYKTQGLPFVRSQNVGWGVLLLDDVAFIDEKTHATFLATEIKVDDVLLNITGASIGRCAVADSRIASGNVNQHVCIIRTTEELNPFYLSQYLIADGGQNQIDSFQAGGNRQGLNFVQIRSFKIPTPPTTKEQQKIADCLSSLDARITAQGQKIEALKLHKKGLMQALFPAAASAA